MSARAQPAVDTLEDLTDLDESGVGATEAAKRTGFPTAEALERWLHRADQYPLWLRLKHRDARGTHNYPLHREKRERSMQAVPSDTIAALISRAQDSTRKRTRTKANRLSDLISDLRKALDIEEHEDKSREVARKDIEDLERQLREAKARLKGGGGLITPDGPSSAEIREWARREGVTCPANGCVPTAVREAYLTSSVGVSS